MRHLNIHISNTHMHALMHTHTHTHTYTALRASLQVTLCTHHRDNIRHCGFTLQRAVADKDHRKYASLTRHKAKAKVYIL